MSEKNLKYDLNLIVFHFKRKISFSFAFVYFVFKNNNPDMVDLHGTKSWVLLILLAYLFLCQASTRKILKKRNGEA
jgi:hypothetical protein